MKELVDGEKYWLGACFAIYDKEKDIFIGGNWCIERWQTFYKDDDKKYNQYGFEY